MDEALDLLREPIEDYVVDVDMDVCGLIENFGKAHGFTAYHIYSASRILYEMVNDPDATRVFSFTGNLVATGLRGVIAQLIRKGYFHIVITTCGALDHDIARGLGGVYFKGTWFVDDAYLHEHGIYRLGNVFIPRGNYGLIIEKFVKSLLEDLSRVKKNWSLYEILVEAGRRIVDQNSVIKSCVDRGVFINVPGVLDGAFGTNLVIYSKLMGLKVDIFVDEEELMSRVFSSRRIGGLIVGGGISKHHAIWVSQFKGGLDYSVYLTTAVEYDGSLSGAHPREAISWGKIKAKAKTEVVYGDATLTLPLIVIGLECFMKGKIGVSKG